MTESVVKRPVYHFRGRSDHALDGKGRLNIATRFREVLRQQNDNRVMITPWKDCLKAYPLPQWEEMEMALRAEGKKEPAMINLIRYMIGGVVECSLDKQGRILLPPKLREDCGINREIIVNGMITYFEIWDKRKWEEENKPLEENFQNFEQTLLELGLF
ncbi:division/cell wall cluster transcriptional repressor MraZ [Thermodesulfobacteriota bacterium]